MVELIALLQTTQDRDGRLDTGLINHDLLKAALQSGIFFNVLTVFLKGSGANAMQLTAR